MLLYGLFSNFQKNDALLSFDQNDTKVQIICETMDILKAVWYKQNINVQGRKNAMLALSLKVFLD